MQKKHPSSGIVLILAMLIGAKYINQEIRNIRTNLFEETGSK